MRFPIHTQAERQVPVTGEPHWLDYPPFRRHESLSLRVLAGVYGSRATVEGVMLHGSMIPRSVRRMFDERAEPREEAESQTAVLEIRGRKTTVRLANLSPSGARGVFALMPPIGEKVVLHLLSRGG